MPAKAGIQGFIQAGRSSLCIPASAGTTFCKRRRESHNRHADAGIQGFIQAGR